MIDKRKVGSQFSMRGRYGHSFEQLATKKRNANSCLRVKLQKLESGFILRINDA